MSDSHCHDLLIYFFIIDFHLQFLQEYDLRISHFEKWRNCQGYNGGSSIIPITVQLRARTILIFLP